MADGDEEIELGQLHAGHIRRTIVLGNEGHVPCLTGWLLAVSHRPTADHEVMTELTVAWHEQSITLTEPSSTRALLRPPSWGAEQLRPPPR